MLACRIEDTSEFHAWLSENTGITIRTDYSNKEKPITYIGDTEWGIDLNAGGWVVIDGSDFCIIDEDGAREAVIEYYEKYIKNDSGANVMEIVVEK